MGTITYMLAGQMQCRIVGTVCISDISTSLKQIFYNINRTLQ